MTAPGIFVKHLKNSNKGIDQEILFVFIIMFGNA
jgi:hypothetical protein